MTVRPITHSLKLILRHYTEANGVSLFGVEVILSLSLIFALCTAAVKLFVTRHSSTERTALRVRRHFATHVTINPQCGCASE